MSENLKNFLEIISKDKALQDKVKAFGSDREAALTGLIALAKEIGMELSKADFEAPEGELAEDELIAISGGANGFTEDFSEIEEYGCVCFMGGGGGGHMIDDGSVMGCACVVYGQGGDGKDDHTVCVCPFAGSGA